MGKKINPISFRLGIVTDWSSKWFNEREYSHFLEMDLAIEKYIMENLKSSAVKDVNISRSENSLKIKILSGRPGMIIGRGGSGIEELKNKLSALLMSLRSKQKKGKKKSKLEIEIEVEEVKNFEEHAALVAQSVAEQIEKRVAFRRVLKTTLDSVSRQSNVKGVKIMVAGRLNGAEMRSREWVIEGGIPLHTLRANVDFAKRSAHTNCGTVGVKVWIYKGEVFKKDKRS
jgi:small subunit ribosomal protein S3